MHIVYVSREYPPAIRMGGIASYVREIAETMVKRGHNVTVIAANDNTKQQKKEVINGVNVIRIKGGDFVIPSIETSFNRIKKFRVFYRFFSYRKRIKETIKSLINPDIIEVPEFGAEGYYLHNLKIPVTIRLHTPSLLDRELGGIKSLKLAKFHDYWIGKKELETMSKFKHMSSCSQSLLDWCCLNLKNFTSEADVVFNPLNIANWKYQDNQKYKENCILFAGTVAETKGIGDLVNAVLRLRNNGTDLTLKIAGKLGEYGQKLKNNCIKNNYNWCEFLGHITREELTYLYKECKISCFPSWWENLPMVCLEAMAVGNIVIGSKNGGMSEIINDGIDGFLVNPKNPNELSKVIAKALSLSENEVKTIRQNAYHKISNHFSADVIASKLENHYKNIIKNECTLD